MIDGIRVVDSQVHIWARDTADRPWIATGKSYAHRGGQEFTATQLLAEMDRAGVDNAILVPPSWEGDRNDVVSEAAIKHSGRFEWMGRLDLRSRQGFGQLAAWKRQQGTVGVRLTFVRGESRQWLTDGTADWFWPEAQEASLPVMVYAPGQVEAIRRIATNFPGLRIAIDHLGLEPSDGRSKLDPEVVLPLLPLAQLPNVAVKASALPAMVREPYPFPSLPPLIERVTDSFGAERVFWGSDLSRLPCSYSQAISLFLEECAFLSRTQQEWIMGRGIEAWLQMSA